MQSIWFEWLSEALGWGWLSSTRISQWIIFATAGLVAALLGWRAMRREKLDLLYGLSIIVVAVVAGMLFGHWVAVAFKPGKLLADPWRAVILFKGGVSSFGVYGGAIVGVWIWSRLRGRPMWPHGDAMAPGLLIAAAIARMSCLLHGCDFGRVASDLPFGVRYAKGTPAFKHLERLDMIDPYRGVGLPMHPFPLYESIPVFAIGLALTLWPNLAGHSHGQRATACAALYCLVRTGAEHFRASTTLELVPGFTLIQALCLASAALFGALWWRLGQNALPPSRSTPCENA